MIRRRTSLAIAAALLLVGLTGCTEAPSFSTDQPTYNSNGVSEWKTPQTPVKFSGPKLGGGTVSTSDYPGTVLVINFWYAQCGPCRKEAKTLEQVSKQFAGKKVQFIGVNTLDDGPTAQSFIRDFGVTYPTALDLASGSVQRAFVGQIVPSQTPTTIVLAPSHGATARIIGQLTDASTLSSLIEDALEKTS